MASSCAAQPWTSPTASSVASGGVRWGAGSQVDRNAYTKLSLRLALSLHVTDRPAQKAPKPTRLSARLRKRVDEESEPGEMGLIRL